MEPITIIVGLLTAGAATGVAEALMRFIRAVLSREERAGRSFGQIIRDAIRGSSAAAPEPTLEERIQSLGKVMAESAELLKQITAEIELRATFAKEKKEEAELSIAATNPESLAAMRRMLSTEGNRGIRAGLLFAFLSFVLGIAGTVLVTLYIHPIHESQPSSPRPTQSSSTGSPSGTHAQSMPTK
jgi:hypothetical protein